MEHGQNLRTGVDDQPEPQHLGTTAEPGSEFVQLRCGRWSWKKKRSCRVCACSPARDSQVVMVACRKPKTREATEGSSPSARAESTWATCWEGGFSRYKGVLRLEVNVVRHA